MLQLVDIQVLFQDSALLVINKPAGLATLPDGYDSSLPHIKSQLESTLGRLWIVHRLDKGTSGVLLLARSADAHRSLNSQFEQHQVTKVYHALVIGDPEWEETTVDLPLRPNGDRQHRTVIDLQNGKPAITHLKVLERLVGHSLLEAIPETGRTHQIRAHLSALGLAIIGDKLYKPRPGISENERPQPSDVDQKLMILLGPGMGLHARSLSVTHPLSGEKLNFIAPYPDTWAKVLQYLHPADSGE
ncbi:MAG TPA: RluA family pseudouridine synthase [Anaerolineales bacterium]|nr:RluA family pseudouridine synthase [Anaerolineales bacterium]